MANGVNKRPIVDNAGDKSKRGSAKKEEEGEAFEFQPLDAAKPEPMQTGIVEPKRVSLCVYE